MSVSFKTVTLGRITAHTSHLQAMDNVIPLIPGTMLHMGTYRIIRFLSKGGFGCTYLAEHTLLDKRVAIKELFVGEWCNREQSGSISVAVTGRKPMVDRLHRKFIEEARAQSRMNHPGIVKVTDVFEENGTAYYVMDFIDGESLADRLRRLGHGLPEQEAIGFIRQAAEALHYVHSTGRLHLDVKPANIMIDRGGRAILIDFGVSKQYDALSGENQSTVLGRTPGYSSPEQGAGTLKFFSPASDVYSLGATLYKLLTDKTPTEVNMRFAGVLVDPMPDTISPRVRAAVESAMQLDKSARPQSMAAFLAMLEPQAASTAEETVPASEETVPLAADPVKPATHGPKTPQQQSHSTHGNPGRPTPVPKRSSRRRIIIWVALSAVVIAALALTITRCNRAAPQSGAAIQDSAAIAPPSLGIELTPNPKPSTEVSDPNVNNDARDYLNNLCYQNDKHEAILNESEMKKYPDLVGLFDAVNTCDLDRLKKSKFADCKPIKEVISILENCQVNPRAKVNNGRFTDGNTISISEYVNLFARYQKPTHPAATTKPAVQTPPTNPVQGSGLGDKSDADKAAKIAYLKRKIEDQKGYISHLHLELRKHLGILGEENEVTKLRKEIEHAIKALNYFEKQLKALQ